ncbi:DUF3105 domain-containing protein [Nocardioides sp.]|uniref:DUF3105 domain-containing protein n=1 Tax=Nocardioides sp. TaxID=35761 RepID=UPI0031FE7645|nr:hypothetical protein [Nocardioides sp.]
MAKPAKTDRQAVIEEMRKKQKGAEKRRGYAIVGVCLVLALLIIGAAAYQPIKDWWDLRQFNNVDVSAIGAPASACQKVVTKPANGEQQHVPEGTPVDYQDAPPAFGSHYATPDPMARKMYTAQDRPDLRVLVHNLEHGYTILWYDETAAADDSMMKDIRAIASKFEGTSNLRFKFKAVPWLSTDEAGKKFPDGQHIAFTHWSIGGADAKNSDNQVGVFQYCSAPSGDALKRFMINYPYLDSPEPNAM